MKESACMCERARVGHLEGVCVLSCVRVLVCVCVSAGICKSINA